MVSPVRPLGHLPAKQDHLAPAVSGLGPSPSQLSGVIRRQAAGNHLRMESEASSLQRMKLRASDLSDRTIRRGRRPPYAVSTAAAAGFHDRPMLDNSSPDMVAGAPTPRPCPKHRPIRGRGRAHCRARASAASSSFAASAASVAAVASSRVAAPPVADGKLVHVSALLRKFGISGRGDLSAAVRASELTAPPHR